MKPQTELQIFQFNLLILLYKAKKRESGERATVRLSWGFPASAGGKEPTCQTRVRSLGWEDPLKEGMATHSSILAWRIPRGAWWATVHRVTKSRTQLSDWAHTDACKAFMGPRLFHLCGFLLPFIHTHTHTHMCIYIYIYTHTYVCIIKVFYDCICIKVNIFWVISVFILIQSMGLT